ncbi:DMT family transporter [Flavihumibacter sp. UBA7668]|uniref:DMT family transporter n=1 Tax=Flavihumibacter sp. UBA7668 TaxID=1946542 RepID=UPI0025C0FB04|nr:DMT family transporter [Flavihumibacter sp. UBA7668]
MKGKFVAVGILFAFLWSSAATATKLALDSAQPLTIAVTRFLFAGFLMLLISHAILKKRRPQSGEWKQLAVYGLLNVSIYLGIYVVAMQYLGAGLGSLAIAVNPLFISLLAAIFFRYRITGTAIFCLLICSVGVLVAAWPMLENSYATPVGMVLLFTSMLTYSIAAIYYTRQQWNGLDILTINGWHTLIGGLFLLPIAHMGFDASKNNFDGNFWLATGWLAIPVSIGAVQAWLYLLKINTVAASYWLYLCPVFGFLLAFLVLNEPITWFTVAGMLLVIGGLYISQRKIN